MDINFKKIITEKASCEIHFIHKKEEEFIFSECIQ